MTGCQLVEAKAYGFAALVLSNRWLSTTIVPHFGGKLTTLYDRKHGYDWLWTSPYLTHLRPLGITHPLELFEMGGWDECFPALLGGPYPVPPWNEWVIPEHGDLWQRDWRREAVENSARRIVVRMSTEGEFLPYTFERSMTLEGGEAALTLDYRLHNESHVPMPFVWSSHPVFRIDPQTRIRLPKGARVRVDHAIPPGAVDDHASAAWPRLSVRGHDRDLDVALPQSEGWAAKLFVSGLSDGLVSLQHPSGQCLRLEFSTSEIPNLGVWLNYGGVGSRELRPFYHLGLQPSIGAADALGEAVTRGTCSVLPPSGEKRWTIKLVLE